MHKRSMHTSYRNRHLLITIVIYLEGVNAAPGSSKMEGRPCAHSHGGLDVCIVLVLEGIESKKNNSRPEREKRVCLSLCSVTYGYIHFTASNTKHRRTKHK